MTPAAILDEARAAGVTLWAEGDALRYRGPREALLKLLDRLKAHKPEILATLARHDDAEDLRKAFEERAKNAKAEGVDLPSLLTEACQGVPGIDAATFRALLSPEDVEEIAGGHYPVETLQAYAESLAEGIASGRIKLLPSADDRRRCRTCRNYRADHDPKTGYCTAYRAHVVDHPPRRCVSYVPRPDDPDQRTGRERWPGLGGAVSAARRTRGKSQRTWEQIESCHEILAEIQPASVRAVCYRLFITMGLIPDMSKTSTNGISRQLVYARENGIIPWEWVVDETREPERVAAWDNPERRGATGAIVGWTSRGKSRFGRKRARYAARWPRCSTSTA